VNGAPGPLLALCGAIAATVLLTSQPLLLVALTCGTGYLIWRTPGPRVAILVGGALSILSFALLNPFVVEQGDTIIFSGPSYLDGLFNLQVTVEELVYGAAAGFRIAAVTFASMLFVLRCDPDRLSALAARVAPRSALAVALAGRLFPTLRYDASAISDAARARGLRLDAGRRRERVRAGATLVAPLLATGLERGLEVAEAMTARGYGAGARTRLPSPRTPAVERVLYLPALLLAAVITGLRLAGEASFSYYPTLGDATTPASLLATGAAALALLVAGVAFARWPSPS
jgi:energy-coupling factor transport system permease protein